ncbi:MAG: hypothetical protein AVDCRST_MAG41-2338, partial [uncultured Corynebacteriales bacterium]
VREACRSGGVRGRVRAGQQGRPPALRGDRGAGSQGGRQRDGPEHRRRPAGQGHGAGGQGEAVGHRQQGEVDRGQQGQGRDRHHRGHDLRDHDADRDDGPVRAVRLVGPAHRPADRRPAASGERERHQQHL